MATGNVTLQPCATHSRAVYSPWLQAMPPCSPAAPRPQQRSVVAIAAGSEALQPCAAYSSAVHSPKPQAM